MKIVFWKKFSYFLLIGISAMLLLAAGQEVRLNNVFAQSVGECIDGQTYIGDGQFVPGCSEDSDDPGQPPVDSCPSGQNKVGASLVGQRVDDAIVGSDLQSYTPGSGQCGYKYYKWESTLSDGDVCTTFSFGPWADQNACPKPATQPPACDLKNETYGQCGSDIAPGACVGAPFPATHNIEVTRTVDFNTCTAVYSCADKGEQPGICGVPTTPPPPPAPEVPPCDDSKVFMSVSPNPAKIGDSVTFTVGGSQGSTWIGDSWSGGVNCGGTFWGSKACQAVSSGNNFSWTHTWQNTAPNNFDIKSSVCSKTVNFSIQADEPPPPPPPPPAPACIISANPNPCTIAVGSTSCSSLISWTTNTDVDVKLAETGQLFAQSGAGSNSQNAPWISEIGTTFNCLNRSTGSVLDSVRVTGLPAIQPPPPPPGCVPNGSCSAQIPLSCGQVNQGVDNCGNVCFRQSAACVPQGGTDDDIIINNTNNNTNNNTQNQTVNLTQSFGNVGVGRPAQVAGVQVAGVKELPKTGLPAMAWLISALIPTGFTMRRFRKVKKELESDPNYIWEDREFKTGV